MTPWQFFLGALSDMSNLLKSTIVAVAATLFAGNAFAGSVNSDGLSYDATLASPGYYNGTGNSSDHFTVYTDSDQNLELGLGFVYRYTGPQVTPDAGTSTYRVNTGISSTNCIGSCAPWNYEFSVNLNLLGTSSRVLNDVTTTLSVLNVGNGQTYDVPVGLLDNSGYGSAGKTSSVDGSTQWGEQNSQNLGFFYVPSSFAFDPLADDTYIFTLTVSDSQTEARLGQVSATVIAGAGAAVAQTPLPGALPLFASGLAAFGVFAGRRRKQAAKA